MYYNSLALMSFIFFFFFSTYFIWNIFYLSLPVYLNTSLLATSIEIVLLFVLNRNASFSFYSSYISILFIWVTFYLFIPLMEWSINLSVSFWFRIENISQKIFHRRNATLVMVMKKICKVFNISTTFECILFAISSSYWRTNIGLISYNLYIYIICN